MKSINLNGNLYYFEDPCVMGILNYTEDSFFDGGKYFNESALIDRVQQMCREGADIIDLGCLSTRPQSQAIDESEELYRIQYVIEILNRFFPNIILSIDTYRASVADYALSHGAAMINDISGGEFDPQIWDVVAKYHVPYVLTHTSGLPANMQQKTNYKNIIDEILLYFSTKLQILHQKGIHDIILDPGFGFGKTVEQNYCLFKNLDYFKLLNCPIMIGISRKSMIYKLLETDAAHALNGTTALHAMAADKQISYFRVHDVAEMAEIKKIFKTLKV